MADRSTQTLGIVCPRPFFWLFAIAALLFFVSWFLLLDSTSPPHFIEHMVPNPKPSFNSKTREADSSLHNAHSSFSDSNGPREHETAECDSNNALLKVFMYDLPPEFHFGLLDWKPKKAGIVWPDLGEVPDYPGGLNLQHSIEYWLTLDLLNSRSRSGPCVAIRVLDSRDADVVFVPFFSSVSFNRHSKVSPPAKVSRNKLLQDKLVEFLTSQEEWKRSGGRDHVILAHHPNSIFDVRLKLWPCMFILSDFGRYPPTVANVEKDVIAPYKHVIGNYVNDSAGYDDRPTLLYFQGAVYRKDVSDLPIFVVSIINSSFFSFI